MKTAAVISLKTRCQTVSISKQAFSGLFMSGFLIILRVHWVDTNALRNRRRGLRWIFTSMLEDLEYTDIALI